jgi:hypothetical protein
MNGSGNLSTLKGDPHLSSMLNVFFMPFIPYKYGLLNQPHSPNHYGRHSSTALRISSSQPRTMHSSEAVTPTRRIAHAPRSPHRPCWRTGSSLASKTRLNGPEQRGQNQLFNGTLQRRAIQPVDNIGLQVGVIGESHGASVMESRDAIR